MPKLLHLVVSLPLLVTTALFSPTYAAEKAGVSLPDSRNFAGSELVLNGIGVREYGLLKWDGYVAGLYLPERQNTADAILTMAKPAVLQMRYVRGGGDAADAREVWQGFLRKNCEALACEWPKAAVEQFLAVVPAAVKGNTETYAFYNGSVLFSLNGALLVKVDDATLAKLLLASWIGPKPSSAALKRDLLGE